MQPTLFDLAGEPDEPAAPVETRPADQAARDFAVDPRNHVVLEASAGTGKTRVLVDRFVRLLDAGVDPRHILAITFTRKAAAEMRDRVMATLASRAAADPAFRTKWRALADRVADIQVSTIDAFCFGLLREFPLEAGVDPGFEIADETEMARFAAEALDLTFRQIRPLIAADPDVRLLLSEVPGATLRDTLAGLIDRRHVLGPAIASFVSRHVTATTPAAVAATFLGDIQAASAGPELAVIRRDGPHGAADFDQLIGELADPSALRPEASAQVRQFEERLRAYCLNDKDEPRSMAAQRFKPYFVSAEARKRHDQALKVLAPRLKPAFDRFDVGVDGLLARGLLRVVAIASETYERLLAEHALLDFAAMLDKAVALLSRQEEFARSRLKLQSRYHHVLVDEFQDTSRQQWRLIELLIEAWSEGEGSTDAPTSIFIVGDRKQSIYRFRQAEVALLDEAARKIGHLAGRAVTRAITHSFRAVPELLAFVNALGAEMAQSESGDGLFRYEERDRFPVITVQPGARRDGEPVVGLIAGQSDVASAAAIAAEVDRLLQTTRVRDRQTPSRPARPEDIAILFRARAGHRLVEDALAARGIRSYVYKGLGFFDAPEVQDLQALLRFLARPDSDLRAAEFLRSRFVRLSDEALVRLAPDLASTLVDSTTVEPAGLGEADRLFLARLRADVPRWIALAGQATPGVVVDTVMADTAYAWELSGRRLDQARENVKKVRALVRRVENRGYATLDRLAEYFETLRAGEESNAIVAAAGCVHLMTIHAAKGLEFPIVFVVNLHQMGRGGGRVRVIERDGRGEPHVAFRTTDQTRAEDRHDREELRRVFYVAVTRARDRLYLGGELGGDGLLLRRQGSLASLLPATLATRFAEAASAGATELEWASGEQTFAFRVCLPPESAVSAPEPVAADEAAPLDMAPLIPAGPTMTSASAFAAGAGAGRPAPAAEPSPEPRLIGTLVHRLLARPQGRTGSREVLHTLAREAATPAELAEVTDPGDLIDRVVRLTEGLRDRPEVRALLDQGRCHYEVPISYRPPDSESLVRGALDCVVERPDGQWVVLEFKTGRPRPADEAQVALYVRALGQALETSAISGQIIYP